jgi:hypothetical protein
LRNVIRLCRLSFEYSYCNESTSRRIRCSPNPRACAPRSAGRCPHRAPG